MLGDNLVPGSFCGGLVPIRLDLGGGRTEVVSWEIPTHDCTVARLDRDAAALAAQLAADGAVSQVAAGALARDVAGQLRVAASRMTAASEPASEELYLVRADCNLPGGGDSAAAGGMDVHSEVNMRDQFVWDATGPQASLDAFAKECARDAGLPAAAAAPLAAELRAEAIGARRMAGSDPSLQVFAPAVQGRGAVRRAQLAQAEATDKGSSRIAPLTLNEEITSGGVMRDERDMAAWTPVTGEPAPPVVDAALLQQQQRRY